MKALGNALSTPGLRRLLIAQIPADFADWLDFVAIAALLAFVWQVGPGAFAWLVVALGLPYLLIGPLAGVLVDRTSLRWVLILSNVGRGLATFGLVFAPDVPVLLGLVFLRSAIDTFFSPAKQAAIQALVPEDRRMAANGISHAINQASKIAGPAVGGLLLLVLTPQSIFLVNAGVSLVAAAILTGLAANLVPSRTATAHPSIVAGLREGFGEFRRKPVLALGLTLMAGGYFAMFFYDALIPLLTRALQLEETVFGLAIAAAGAGGVVSSILLGAVAGSWRPFLLMGAGYSVAGPIAVVVGWMANASVPIDAVTFIALFGVIGFATAAVVVPFRTIIQREADPERIGRVSAICETVTITATLVAPFIGAALARLYSVGTSFITGGLVLVCFGVLAFVLTAMGRDRSSA